MKVEVDGTREQPVAEGIYDIIQARPLVMFRHIGLCFFELLLEVLEGRMEEFNALPFFS